MFYLYLIMTKRIVVATIAGSDPSGGAGLQADLRVFTLLGAYGQTVITAATVQNSLGVKGFEALEATLVRDQLEALFEDLPPWAVKTGMLATMQIIEAVAEVLRKYRPVLVVDPVMVSASGHPLLSPEAVETLKARLLPLADVMTPNLPEAQVLTGKEALSLRGQASLEKLVQDLYALGPKAVILKGGHTSGPEAVDLVYDGRECASIRAPRLQGPIGHGTGCSFSAALTVYLAQGLSLLEAAHRAKNFVYLALKAAQEAPLGRGISPTDPLIHLDRLEQKSQVLFHLEQAARYFCSHPVRPLIPEVQSNLVYALPYAQGHHEVAAFPGRIVALGEGATIVGCPRFGASRHVANIVLTAMSYNPSIRSAMNIRFDEAYLQIAQKKGLRIGEFSRAQEPKEIKSKEGSTLSWAVALVCKSLGYVPDIIADRGEVGKEPMIRILGPNPLEVVKKALLFLRED